MKNDRISKYLTYIFTIIIMFLLIGFLMDKEYTYIVNLIAIYLGYMMIIYLEKKKIITISNFVKFSILLTSVLHLTIGQYFELYKTSIYFDKILHLIGAFAVSLFSYEVLISFFEREINSKFLAFILITSIGTTIGVFLEIFEFALDMIFDGTNQYGLMDTNFDMIFNVIGAIIAGIWAGVKV